MLVEARTLRQHGNDDQHDVGATLGATLVVAPLADTAGKRGDHKGRPYSRQCRRSFNPSRLAEAIV